MAFEFIKLVSSKDFVQNAKSVISILRKNKEWKKDIVNYNGTFMFDARLDCDVLIERALTELSKKGWDPDEIDEVHFIITELVNNSFSYGLPNKEYSSVHVDIIITTPYVKISITDNGSFNLKEELITQECTIPGSIHNKGLSFIFQITPEISQNSLSRNEIVVIKRKGCRTIETEMFGDIVVLKVGTSRYITGDNYTCFGKELLGIQNKQKVVVDFSSEGGRTMIWSRGARNARSEIGAAVVSGSKVCICGLRKAPFPIRAYFLREFHVEDTLQAALNYLLELDSTD